MENTLAESGQLFTELSYSLEQSLPALEQFSQALDAQPEIKEFLSE